MPRIAVVVPPVVLLPVVLSTVAVVVPRCRTAHCHRCAARRPADPCHRCVTRRLVLPYEQLKVLMQCTNVLTWELNSYKR